MDHPRLLPDQSVESETVGSSIEPTDVPHGARREVSCVWPRSDPLSAENLFAYIAAVAAHPADIERFRKDLATPGLRIPLTSDADTFTELDAVAMQAQGLVADAPVGPSGRKRKARPSPSAPEPRLRQFDGF